MDYNTNGLGSDTKQCNSCKEIKPKTDFYSNGSNPQGTKKYKPKCKQCYSKVSTVEKLNKIILALNELERKYVCEHCGYDKNFAALTFHHIDPSTKSFKISDAGVTRAHNTIVSEIKKCAILCANCHAEEHNPALNNPASVQ